MSSTTDLRHVLIGTAGHIDHGKTRLVARLTGTDTDRLPEEKTRGISIDLGFAHWDSDGLRFGVVDVPGHERFVRNMVAGATGVNLALLVVAADDGVMPQTREHLDIMDLLGLRTGVVAVTKTDLVEPEYVELVRAEVAELVAGTFLEGAPVIAVSSATGDGLDDLRAAVVRVAAGIDRPAAGELFRMPIDRAFSVSGHGTVVTGSVLSGEVHAGDTLELLPAQRSVRVRGVQSHGAGVAESGARRRTAVNLAGVRADDVTRGMELATPGTLQPTRRLLVELRALPGAPVTLRDRSELRLHLGTAEALARLVLKGGTLEPGAWGYAELRTRQPVVAAYGQRFILRRISPPLTVVGGTVLDPLIPPHARIRDLARHAAALASRSEHDRLGRLLAEQNRIDGDPLRAAWRVGVPVGRYAAVVADLTAAGELIALGRRDPPWLIHRDRLAAVSRSVLRTVRAEIERHQPRRALPRSALLAACGRLALPELLDAILTRLIEAKELVQVGPNLGPPDVQPKLTRHQQQTRDRLLEQIAAGGAAPPIVKELATTLAQRPEQLLPLLNLCVEDGLLVRVSDQLYYTPRSLDGLRQACEAVLCAAGQATVSELREAWGVSRKFAVPLSEFFDAAGVTVRRGDVRLPGPRLRMPLCAGEERGTDEGGQEAPPHGALPVQL